MKTFYKVTLCLSVLLFSALSSAESTQNGQLITDTRTTIDSTYTEVVELAKHVHSSNYVYGLNAVAPIILTRPSTIPIRVTGGTDVFGTSILLDKGDGAINQLKYDVGKIQVMAVETANVPTIIRFYSATAGGAVAYTMKADDEIVTAAGHGVVNGDRIIFDTIVGGYTHGVTPSIVYFVREMSGNTFKVELTSGGGVVAIDADLSGNIKKLTTTFNTEVIVSMAATNADSGPATFPAPRILSASMLYCEARSHGASKWVDFFLDVHTYAQ